MLILVVHSCSWCWWQWWCHSPSSSLLGSSCSWLLDLVALKDKSSWKDILSTTDTFNFFLASFKFPYQNENLNLKTNTWQQLDAMQKKIQADWKHNGSFLLNAPWQNPWSSGPWQNPWMLRFIISMGFAMELWENPLHGKTHISWVLPWYMGFAIDLWQNPLDTLFRPRHAV